MADHYVKLWASILQSSIWSQSLATRVVWITMIAMADEHGFVGASVDGIARMANVTTEEAKQAITEFLAPDPYSRNQENEGRRICVVPRGWHVLNHKHFRDMRDKEARRAYERLRKAEQRARKRPGHVPDTGGTHRDGMGQPETNSECPAMSAHAEASEEASVLPVGSTLSSDPPPAVPPASGGELVPTGNPLGTHWEPTGFPKEPEGFDAFWNAYGRKEGRKAAVRAWGKLSIAKRAEVMGALPRFLSQHPEVRFRPHPATFLNGERWLDEPATVGSAASPAPTTRNGLPKIDGVKRDYGGIGVMPIREWLKTQPPIR
jgi:hypothetical protein